MATTLGKKDKMNEIAIYWRIENFNCKPSKNLFLRSPSFETNSLKSTYHMEIQQKYGFLSVYLVKETYSVTTSSTISTILLSNLGWITILENVPVHFGKGQVHVGVDQLISFVELKDQEWIYLANGALTVGFYLWNEELEKNTSQTLIISRLIHSDKNDLHHRPIQTFSNLKPDDLLLFPLSYEFQEAKEFFTQNTQTVTSAGFHDSEELLNFFRQKEFSFVTLRTPNKEFVVHKAVLCAKSPVFNAMLERNMIERDSNLIRIDDIESETVSLLIKFLHFQPLGSLSWDDVSKLYYAADKYQIESIKKMCKTFLETVLSTENMCDLYVLADRHQDKDLMICVEKYFRENSEDVLHSEKWREFLNNFVLGTRICTEMNSHD